jgi:hypothetical protein
MTPKKRSKRSTGKVRENEAHQNDDGTRARKSRRRKRSALTADVLNELHALRASLKRMVETYTLRVDGRLAEMVQLLEGDSGIDQPPRLLTLQAADQILAEIGAADLKPEKGRPGDFRRLQRVTRRLRTFASPEDG